mmetsp:Transcript_134555/g.335749  ORF Transcript_134555/g.335749 Transcript_134555/m.335749 type:complete len:124 (+) Transcript_134555:125-496(+)
MARPVLLSRLGVASLPAAALAVLAAILPSSASGEPAGTLPPHIQAMVLSTPKPVTDAQMTEFKQDFVDVDFNKDDIMDAQEVRAHFKGGIGNLELYQFFLDSDKDHSGAISLQEYVDYATMLN